MTDDAIIKRLKLAGTKPFEDLLVLVGAMFTGQTATPGACELAPFAREIVAIDEMSGEQMQRHLKEQRSLKPGDKKLLPGKLAGRFNIRSQQWELVQWREDALGNCKVDALSLLAGLACGSLILADLGYFAFPWFDELTKRGYWWISRLREKTSYSIVHTFYRHEGTLDALIWLGGWRANQAGEMVRLVRFWDGRHLHCYITNVLDPHQLSMKQIAQLYARRWDIELAFLLLKKHLGLSHWWSSQTVLLQQQCLVVLVVAQLLQGLRLQIAEQAGVDVFEVSMALLVEKIPELLMNKQEPLEWMSNYGKELMLIRAHTRLEPVVPEIAAEELVMPVEPLQKSRKARYARYGEKVVEGREDAVVSKTGTAKKRAKKKREVVDDGKVKDKEKKKKSKRTTKSRGNAEAYDQSMKKHENGVKKGKEKKATTKSQRKAETCEQSVKTGKKCVKTEEKKEKQNKGVDTHMAPKTGEKGESSANTINTPPLIEKPKEQRKLTKPRIKRETIKQPGSLVKEEIPLFSG